MYKYIFAAFLIILSLTATAEPLNRMYGNNFSSIPTSSAEPQGFTYYLHLVGSDSETSANKLMEELKQNYIQPLLDHQTEVIYSYSAMVYGKQQQFIMNLIVEPTTQNIEFLQKYIAEKEGAGFHQSQAIYQKVDRIFETNILQIGKYAPQNEDAFENQYTLSRSRILNSVQEWSKYNAEFGGAMIAKDSAKFLKFIENFVGDPHQYKFIRDQFLATNNMVEFPSYPYLILQDNSVVETTIDVSPFLPFIFTRNCWSGAYEHGNCYKPLIF